jgi:hypothetical protein
MVGELRAIGDDGLAGATKEKIDGAFYGDEDTGVRPDERHGHAVEECAVDAAA